VNLQVPPAMGLYIHIPFCLRKCVYCDFNSFPVVPGAAERYVRALFADISRARDMIGGGPRPSTLYIGGGTPTILPAGELAEIVSACAGAFGLESGAEVTVECNPGTADYRSLRRLREAGVNRLSIGAQALDDTLLQGLGRIHTSDDVRACVRDARLAGFANINLDLMFGIPHQTVRRWAETLERVVGLDPQHISIYPLEVEEGTPLEESVSRGDVVLPTEDDVLAMWDAAMETLETAGYSRYEISNYSRPGYESAHNLIYWRNGEYLGLGAGACSHYGRRRYYNARLPLDFCLAVEEGRSPVSETIPPAEAPEGVAMAMEMTETAIMGLRLADGLSLQGFQERFGRCLRGVFPGVIEDLAASGLVSESGGSVRLTRRGLFVANAVFREFVSPVVS